MNHVRPAEPATERALVGAANALHDQALEQLQRGRLRRALILCRHALGFVERVSGPSSADAANVGNTLASIDQERGDLADAERLFRRSVEISQPAAADRDTHTIYVQSLDGLARAPADRAPGRPRSARRRGEPYARKSVEIREAALGANHVEVAADLSALAALLDGQGKLEEAEAFYRRALHILESAFGPDHHHLAVTLNNLAAIHFHARQSAARRGLLSPGARQS